MAYVPQHFPCPRCEAWKGVSSWVKEKRRRQNLELSHQGRNNFYSFFGSETLLWLLMTNCSQLSPPFGIQPSKRFTWIPQIKPVTAPGWICLCGALADFMVALGMGTIIRSLFSLPHIAPLHSVSPHVLVQIRTWKAGGGLRWLLLEMLLTPTAVGLVHYAALPYLGTAFEGMEGLSPCCEWKHDFMLFPGALVSPHEVSWMQERKSNDCLLWGFPKDLYLLWGKLFLLGNLAFMVLPEVMRAPKPCLWENA